MNPDTRRLVKMEYMDFSEANDIFSRLMGEDVTPRRKFIFEHYKEVTNLDI
jgi:DNA gyrase subunit B